MTLRKPYGIKEVTPFFLLFLFFFVIILIEVNNMFLYDDILKDGKTILRDKCEEVQIPILQEDYTILYQMNEYLYNGYDNEFCKKNNIKPGVGLAAPQVGVSKKMLCILAYDEKGNLYNYCMINPKITSYSEEKAFLESGEGCLSVPDEHKGYVHRHRRIKVSTYLYDFDKNIITKANLQFKGYLAIIFQHEFDHLNGVLYYDHINKKNPFFIPDNSNPITFKTEEE